MRKQLSSKFGDVRANTTEYYRLLACERRARERELTQFWNKRIMAIKDAFSARDIQRSSPEKAAVIINGILSGVFIYVGSKE